MRVIINLLSLTAVVALLGPIVDRRERIAESTAREYGQAVATRDVDAALEALDPATRADWRIFVEHQAGDRIHLLSVSVQRVPLISGPPGWWQPESVTIVAEIDGKGGEHWRATSWVRGRLEGDRWFLERPLFGPDEPWLVPPAS